MSERLRDLADLEGGLRPLLAAHCDPVALAAAEKSGWHADLWAALEAAGYTGVGVPEPLGGAGGTPTEALALLRAAGAGPAPVPLAESGILTGHLLEAAGLTMPDGPRSVVPPSGATEMVVEDGAVSGWARAVPWGRRAEWVATVLTDGVSADVLLLPGPACGAAIECRTDTNLAGEPRDDLRYDATTPLWRGPADGNWLDFMGAASRAALMAGAVTSLARLTLEYTGQRRQFGRPVSRFQAVQQHLIHIHQQMALANAAVDGMLVALDQGSARFEIAVAKQVTSRAAVLATRASHQAHGAIGMTQEYPLHYWSRRLWAWRNEYGNERHWGSLLGGAVAGAGAGALYPAITAGSGVLAL